MAEVTITPRIRCDNCGFVQDKEGAGKEYRKPRRWGSAVIFSGRGQDGYPPEELRFIDLCPDCAKLAHDAVALALRTRRGEVD